MAATLINLTHKPRPDFDVYIGRAQLYGKEYFGPSPWANPFSWRKLGRQEAIRRYEERLLNTPELLARLPELEGKVLGCWSFLTSDPLQPPDGVPASSKKRSYEPPGVWVCGILPTPAPTLSWACRVPLGT